MKIDGEADAVALEAAERIESSLKGKAPGGAPQRKARIQCIVRDAIDRATVRQRGAAISGMNAAKANALYAEKNAAELYAQSNPEALESEREANERLSNDVYRLEKKLEEAREALRRVGICVDCLITAEMDEEGPWSHCLCGTGEDHAKRPLQRLQLIDRYLAKIKETL